MKINARVSGWWVAGLVAGLNLVGASAASAHTYAVSNTAEFETALANANANSGASTIELANGVYSPKKKVTFTNTSGTLTIVGSASAPGVTLNGGSVQPFPSELFEIDAGVSVVLRNVTVTTGGGSGVVAISDFGDLEVEDSTIAGNNGGGVDVQSGATATVRNSTLSDGLEFGMIDSGTASFFNSTVAFNNGGIDNTNGTLNLTNTIVADNGISGDCVRTASASDHSLDSDGSCGVGALSGENPLLNSKLLKNGGPTSTHVLQVGSPAIDAGDTAACPATDQRGLARPDVASTACDLGTTEYYATAPTITVPANITTGATSVSGAVVTYSFSVTSPVAKVESSSCTPASGSTFPVGMTTVKCTATDSQGNTATNSFTVTVEAQALPKHTLTVTVTGEGTVASAPAGIECGKGHTHCSAEFVEGEAVELMATPAVGNALSAWSGACSGSGACSVKMSADESVTADFGSVPQNTGLPQISGEPNVGQTLKTTNGTWTESPISYSYQWEDCDNSGASCTSIASATSSEYTLTQVDLGHTIRALVKAIDGAGESVAAESAATAAVKDTTAPELHVPSNMTVSAEVPSGAKVSYTVTAADSDNSAGELTVECSPASGATFPLGETTVSCTAKDPAGNTSHASFKVTVKEATPQQKTPETKTPETKAPEAKTPEPTTTPKHVAPESPEGRIRKLLEEVKSSSAPHGIRAKLAAMLKSVLHGFKGHHAKARNHGAGIACRALGQFVRAVAHDRRLRKHKLAAVLASSWTDKAMSVESAMGCSSRH